MTGMAHDAARKPIQADSAHSRGLSERMGPAVVLTVGGFDPSGGAGIVTDLKVFWNHGLFGVSAVTALTVQSSQGVRGVEAVSGGLLRRTLDCLAADVGIAGVKIGMLATAENVLALAGWPGEAGIPRERVVLDPVLRSSSGAELLEAGAVEKLRSKLLPWAGWITPNVDELAVLTGRRAADHDGVPAQARMVQKLAEGLNVVVTGGHLDPPDDFLLTAEGEQRWFPGRHVETTSTHGTGCAFSSALLSRLVLGDAPAEAVGGAKAWVTRALETAAPVGKGRGPVVL